MYTFIHLHKNLVLFESLLRKKERNRDLELGKLQSSPVCLLAYWKLWIFLAYLKYLMVTPWGGLWDRVRTSVYACYNLENLRKFHRVLFHTVSQHLYSEPSPTPGATDSAHVCSGEFPLATEPQTSVTWLSYCFAISVLFHGLLAMTQGKGLLGFHETLQREWLISESPFVLGESDFLRDNLIKPTIPLQAVATKLLVTPRHSSYYKHLPM